MGKIIEYVLYDLLRSRVVIAYAVLLLLISIGLFALQGQADKALLALWNIALIVVPIMSIIFPTIHMYNSYEFMELMLAQPIQRKTLLLSEWLSLGISLSVAFFIGLGLPVLISHWSVQSLWVVGSGLLMTWVFVGLAVLVAVITRDKTRGMGISLLSWLYFSLIFDSIVLLILLNFSDYPLETPMLVLSLFNPLDLSRIMVLLQMDTAALMGFSGAVFQEFFGSITGILVIFFSLLIWASLPPVLAVRIFNRKDL